MDQFPPITLPLDWTLQPPSASFVRDSENLKATATQFEALLIGTLLRGMREAGGGGWLGAGEHDAASSMMELAEQHLALVLASQGGLGFAQLVHQGLAASAAKSGPRSGSAP